MQVANPTSEDIKSWAYSQSEWPHDEWDLFLSWTKEVELFIDLAADHKCPKRGFFLHMLYYLVGVTFNEPCKADAIAQIEAYVKKADGQKHGDIRKWVENVDALLKGKQKYEYANWRGGRYAQYQFT